MVEKKRAPGKRYRVDQSPLDESTMSRGGWASGNRSTLRLV
jgi:hypothetical protein